MNRLLAMFVLLCPITAAAQDLGVRPDPPRDSAQPSASASNAAPSRRRPSMVGYIGDSTVTSQVRIRFDAGWGIEAPDRAEFFYAKCGCYRGLPPTNAAFDPNAPGPGPGVLTDLNYQQLWIQAEYAPISRISLTAELPFRFLKPETFAPGTGSFPNQSGVSDLQVGAKVALVSSAARQLTAAVNIWTPTGDSLKGLGTNHWSVEPLLLYAERPNDRLAIEAQLGDVIPTGGSAGVPTNSSDKFWGSVVYWGVGPSYVVYRSAQVSVAPVVELVGWHVVSGFQTADVADASGTNIVNLKIGGRVLAGQRNALYIGVGHALTTADWYNNLFRIEYRVSF